MNVAMFSCPFGVTSPSLALGIFKAQISQFSVNSKIFYLNLDLAQKMGLGAYEKYKPHGEWAFSRLVTDEYDDTKYFQENEITLNEQPIFLTFRRTAEAYIENITDQDWDYDVFAFTVGSHQLFASLAIARKLKEKYPTKPIIFGGYTVHGDVGTYLIKQFPFVDVIFLRDADESFCEFIMNYQSTNDVELALKDIDGVATKSLVKLPKERLNFDIDHIPIPDFSDWINNIKTDFTDDRFNAYPIELSRGCYYGRVKTCTFCSDVAMCGYSFIPRSPDSVYQYFEDLKVKYPKIIHWDVADSSIPDQYINIFHRWNENHSEPFGIVNMELKPWISREGLTILRKFGVHSLTTGIENFSIDAINMLNKGHKMYQTICFLKWCKLLNIKPVWMYLIDIPGEKEEFYVDGLRMVKKLLHFTPPMVILPVQIRKQSTYYLEREKWNLGYLKPEERWSFLQDAEFVAYSFSYKPEQSPGLLDKRAQLAHELSSWMKPSNRSLVFTGDKVHDTRSTDIIIDITHNEKRLLVHCDAPQKEEEVIRSFPDVDLNRLVDLDLLVLTEHRFVSLVEST